MMKIRASVVLGAGVLMAGLTLFVTVPRQADVPPLYGLIFGISPLLLSMALGVPLLVHGLSPGQHRLATRRVLRRVLASRQSDPVPTLESADGPLGAAYIFLAALIGVIGGLWLDHYLGPLASIISLALALAALLIALGPEPRTFGVMTAAALIALVPPFVAGMYVVVSSASLAITCTFVAWAIRLGGKQHEVWRFIPSSLQSWMREIIRVATQLIRVYQWDRQAREYQAIIIILALLIFGIGPWTMSMWPHGMVEKYGSIYLTAVYENIALVPLIAFLFYALCLLMMGWQTLLSLHDADDPLKRSPWWPLGTSGPFMLLFVAGGPLLLLSGFLWALVSDSVLDVTVNLLLGFLVFPRVLFASTAAGVAIIALAFELVGMWRADQVSTG